MILDNFGIFGIMGVIYQRDIEMIWDTGEIREIYQRHSTSEGYGSDFKLFSSDFGVMLSKFLEKMWILE